MCHTASDTVHPNTTRFWLGTGITLLTVLHTWCWCGALSSNPCMLLKIPSSAMLLVQLLCNCCGGGRWLDWVHGVGSVWTAEWTVDGQMSGAEPLSFTYIKHHASKRDICNCQRIVILHISWQTGGWIFEHMFPCFNSKQENGHI
jgi:hypothetical protein